MEKTINKHWGILMAALMAVLSLGVASCSDNDGDGQPVITGVRTCDPETADSLFTKSAQGQTIAIIGKNLGGARKVFINDQEVYFSSTMNTDHSIIVKVPSESDGFQLTAFNSELKDEIRVETTHGTATYGFKVLGSAPSISRIQGSYPRAAGDPLNIYGVNLFSIEKIYFTDVTAEALDTLDWEDVPGNRVNVNDYETIVSDRHLNSNQDYEVTSQLQITTPTLPFDEGSLVLECAAGIVYIPYSKVPGKPVISGINTDMPIPGTDLVIRGREFVQVESVSYGDVTLSLDDFTVADSEDAITIRFSKKPTPGSGTTLTVTTPGGQASVEYFYVYDGLLLNFEPNYATDNGWGPNGELMQEATADAIPYVSDGQFWRIKSSDGGWNWWATMCYFRKDWNGNSFALPGFDLIPADTPAEDIYLAMEVWDNNTDFGGAQWPFMHYQIQTIGDAKTLVFENFIQNDVVYKEKALRAIDNTQPKEQWYRHVTPLSNFDGWAGKTYADIVADGINQIRLMHMNWTGTPSTMDVMLDNVRIYYPKQ